MIMEERFFTPKEANESLPEINKIVQSILTKALELRYLMANPDHYNKRQERLVHLEKEINVLMARLEDRGCYYKDWSFEVGLVDFPAIIHGQQALLCWRSDEPRVEWFHGYEDGYAGRRRITKELIFS